MSERDEEFEMLIERSSLGTTGSRRLRRRAPQDQVAAVRRIVELRDQMEHAPSGEEAAQTASQLIALLRELGYHGQAELAVAEAAVRRARWQEQVKEQAGAVAAARQAADYPGARKHVAQILDELGDGERAEAEPAAQAAPVNVNDSGLLRLQRKPTAVPSARRQVRHELAGLTVPDAVLDDVELVIAELVDNSLRHARPIAGGVLLLAWRVTNSEITIRVTDGGPDASAPSDGGMQIVDRVARVWGVSEHAGGLRSVWAAIALPAAARSGPVQQQVAAKWAEADEPARPATGSGRSA